MAVPEKKLKVDSRGRINLKQLYSEEVTSFRAIRQEDGTILLRPVVDIEIHPEEAWLYKNPVALATVKKGLEDVSDGKISELEEDFWNDIEDEEDDA
ncbi:MAG: hypothetical protein WCG23_11600 [bacterium]